LLNGALRESRHRRHRHSQAGPAFRAARSGKVQRNNVLVLWKLRQQRPKYLRGTHQAVQEDNRGLCRRSASLFEKRNTQAVNREMASV
jgi:hypothetical protein